MIGWIVGLFLSGALMLLGFWGIDFAFLAESCIYVPVLHVCVDAGDFWRLPDL